MSKDTAEGYTKKLKLYEKLVATNPKVERKGDAMPYTSLNGHMFSYLTKTGEVALRLPEEDRGEFLTKYKRKVCEAYGVVQKEYVVVPDSLLKKTDELKNYFEVSYAYVGSLKPNATKEKGRK